MKALYLMRDYFTLCLALMREGEVFTGLLLLLIACACAVMALVLVIDLGFWIQRELQ